MHLNDENKIYIRLQNKQKDINGSELFQNISKMGYDC